MSIQARRISPARWALFGVTLFWFFVILPWSVAAAPYAAMVVDARTGEVLHSRNADTRLHPASLTKMMTLYIAFEAVRNGEITLDTKVKISKHASSEPPSKLGLKTGQRIALRYLIRAAAIKSANDAATAIGEAISGSEAAFARRMTRTAKALGMNRTTFKNAHGLTESGHLSTARDMTRLGRQLLYNFPEYYNLFSRRTTHAGIKTVPNTNRRLLDSYKGADGIKTGYTRAAGFNLVASAERGNERIIATVFGGKSSASRNARVAELLDMGFRRAPSRADVRKPARPRYTATSRASASDAVRGPSGKTIRLVGAVRKSLHPKIRPLPPVQVASVAETAKAEDDRVQAGVAAAVAAVAAAKAGVPEAAPSEAQRRPRARPANVLLAGKSEAAPEVVTRLSTSGGRQWGINVGRYPSRHSAEKVLVKVALSEMATLDGSSRKVVQNKRGFDANFFGMTRDMADLACRRLQARNEACFMIGPS
jgi:D-alanyl-D-alanine carboxypeptidase